MLGGPRYVLLPSILYYTCILGIKELLLTKRTFMAYIGLNENEIISAVSAYLRNQNYEIKKECSTVEKGIDIIAESKDAFLLIEAKGNTSSKPSKRYGMEFTSSQVIDHISKTVRKALEMRDEYPNAKIGIALPDNRKHRINIARIIKSLKELDISVFWVDDLRKVIEE